MTTIKPLLLISLILGNLLLLVTPCRSAIKSLDVAAYTLIKQINMQTELKDTHIQLSETNFSDGTNNMQSLFSKRLSEELAAALAGRGATVSLHEAGEEPLRLMGGFTAVGDTLNITVRLRKMSRDGSKDISISSVVLQLSDHVKGQLNNSLESLAAELVHQLERVYLGSSSVRIKVLLPVPGVPGQPTLKLGKRLQQHLEYALLDSEGFGSKEVVEGTNQQVQVKSSYTLGEEVTFAVSMQQPNGNILARAEESLKKSHIEPLLFEMIQDHKKDICVSYLAKNRRAVSTPSPTVPLVIDGITNILSEVNVQPVECSVLEGGLKIVASLAIDKKQLQDGYGILNGVLTMTITEGNRALGTIREKAQSPYTGHSNDARPELVEKLFSASLRQRLSEKILAWR